MTRSKAELEAAAKACFPTQRFEWPLVRPNPKFKELLDKVHADLNQTQGKPMSEPIEEVNSRIAFLTTGMIKSEPVLQYGATVVTYSKEGSDEPALEVTTYDPGTPIDSEHADLLDEAPGMAKLLAGDADDHSTTRVVLLDLADGVGCTCDELQTEAERSQFGPGVAVFAQELLDSNPDAGDQLRQTYIDESGQTQPCVKIEFMPDADAQMVDGKISGTAEISIPEEVKMFIATNDPGNETLDTSDTAQAPPMQGYVKGIAMLHDSLNESRTAAKSLVFGKDASTHPFDGVATDNPVSPDVDLSKAVLTTFDANANRSIHPTDVMGASHFSDMPSADTAAKDEEDGSV